MTKKIQFIKSKIILIFSEIEFIHKESIKKVIW